jgi:hypothetical protein
MTATVIKLNCLTSLPLEADEVLKEAMGQEFDRLLIIATKEDGTLDVRATHGNVGILLVDMERTKTFLMKQLYGDDDA